MKLAEPHSDCCLSYEMPTYLRLSVAFPEAPREDARQRRLHSFGTSSPLGDIAKAKGKICKPMGGPRREWITDNVLRMNIYVHTEGCIHPSREKTLRVNICSCRNEQSLDISWFLVFSCVIPQGSCREGSVTERVSVASQHGRFLHGPLHASWRGL